MERVAKRISGDRTKGYPFRQARLQSFLDKSITAREIIFVVALSSCLLPWVSPPAALVLGLAVAQLTGHPFLHLNHKATGMLLQFSIVGLGFGMNVGTAMEAGRSGILFTICSIAGTLTAGYFFGKWFRTDPKTSHLISCGTAICGGSAIAAVAPVIKADEKQMSVGLGIVFILNSIALFLFPFIGHLFHLSQSQFGLWAAIAIHDTSSVVAAANKYGATALEIATTVKLARALWIIPVTLLTALAFRNRKSRIRIPYFIGLFIVALLMNTGIPAIHAFSAVMVSMAKTGLTLTLFLIGSGLSLKTIRSVGIKPFMQGLLLWILVSSFSLYMILLLVR